MPFLRMINIAWTSHEQVANQQQIIAAAETVLARVSDFCTAHAKMGKKLEEAKEQRVKDLEEKADKERREWAEKHAKDVLEALKRHEQSEIDWGELIDKLRREKEEREAAEKQEKLSEAKIQESAGESAPDATKVKEK